MTEKKTVAREVEAPLGARIKKEAIAWAWVVLVFLLINGTLGQARVIPSGIDGKNSAGRRPPDHE